MPEEQVADYIDYNNTKRLHSLLFYLTPDDFLNNRITEKLTIRNTELRLAQQARYEVKHAG
jgi:hypothetical protein